MIARPIRSVIMNGGQGDVVMAACGLHAMMQLAPAAFASDLAVFARSYIAPVIGVLLSECRVASIEDGRAAPRPRYYTSAHTSGSSVWRNLAGADYYINYAAARERVSFGAEPVTFWRRVLQAIDGAVVDRRLSWRRSPPTYYGMKKWAPLAERCGFSEIELLAALHRSFWQLRKRMADYAAASLAPAAGSSEIAFFPVGRAFQTIPPDFVAKVGAALPGESLRCYFPAGEQRRDAYERLGIDCATANEPEAMIKAMVEAAVVVTCDSLPSHLAQLAAAHHVAALSHDLPQHTVHPAAPGQVIFRAMPCVPCQYTDLRISPVCRAGRPACGVFADEDYLADLVAAIRQRLPARENKA